MTSRRFEVGQKVRINTNDGITLTRPGIYTVIALLPSEGPSRRYRVRCSDEPHDRIVAEAQLNPANEPRAIDTASG